MSFSKRLGFVSDKQIQINSIDTTLKNKLFNCFQEQLKRFRHSVEISAYILNELGEITMNNISDQQTILRRFLNNGKGYSWYDIYDIIEYFLQAVDMVLPDRVFGYDYIVNHTYGTVNKQSFFELFSKSINGILEEEKSGYRLVNNEFVAITSEEEIESITQAISTPFDAVRIHMQKALSLYSDRQHPDYENSIKESISAVEALCGIITGKKGKDATLGNTIKHLNDKGITIHKSMEEAFGKLYGFTNDAGGIRHGKIDFTNAPSEDALYMLISCSAFVNYLTAKYEQIQ